MVLIRDLASVTLFSPKYCSPKYTGFFGAVEMTSLDLHEDSPTTELRIQSLPPTNPSLFTNTTVSAEQTTWERRNGTYNGGSRSTSRIGY